MTEACDEPETCRHVDLACEIVQALAEIGAGE